MKKKIIIGIVCVAVVSAIIGTSVFVIKSSKNKEKIETSQVQTTEEKQENGELTKFTEDYRKQREVKIEEKVFIFPITYDELKTTGWHMSENDENEMLSSDDSYRETRIDITNDKYPNLKGYISVDNPLKEKYYYKNCLIKSITLNVDDESIPKMELYSGLKLGDSEDKIFELYPEEESENNSYKFENSSCKVKDNKINEMNFSVNMKKCIGEDLIGYDGTLNAKRRWLTQQDFSKGQLTEKPADLALVDIESSNEKSIREYFGYSNEELGLKERESQFSSNNIQANKYVLNKIIETLGSPHEIKGLLTSGAAMEGFDNLTENQKLIVDQSIEAYVKSIASTANDACEFYDLIWYFDDKIIDIYVMEGIYDMYASTDGMGGLWFNNLLVQDKSQYSGYKNNQENVIKKLFPDGFVIKDITKEPFRDYIEEMKKMQEQ